MAKKVLIIDDSITQLSSLKIFFRRAGFEVETAQNGVEGFVKVYKTTPDLIISDVLMPHLGGFQLYLPYWIKNLINSGLHNPAQTDLYKKIRTLKTLFK